jgi:hypothetical protein
LKVLPIGAVEEHRVQIQQAIMDMTTAGFSTHLLMRPLYSKEAFCILFQPSKDLPETLKMALKIRYHIELHYIPA